MIKNFGSILRDEVVLKNWRLLGYYNQYRLNQTHRLPFDVLQICISFASIRGIKLSMVVDDDSFKYIFKDEKDTNLSTVRVKITNSTPSGTIAEHDTHIYKDKLCRYQMYRYHGYNDVLQDMIVHQSLTQITKDFICGLKIPDHFRIPLEQSYNNRVLLQGRKRNYVRPRYQRMLDITTVTQKPDHILFNPKWDLLDVMQGKIADESSTGTVRINLYDDLNGVDQYVCMPKLWRDILEYTFNASLLRKYLTRTKDYNYSRDIEFEDKKWVRKNHPNIYTTFVKLSSLPKFCCISPHYPLKILSIWLTKNFFISEEI